MNVSGPSKTKWIELKDKYPLRTLKILKKEVRDVYDHYLLGKDKNFNMDDIPPIISFFKTISDKYKHDTDELTESDKKLLIDFLNESFTSMQRMIIKKEHYLIDVFIGNNDNLKTFLKPVISFFHLHEAGF